MTGFSALCMYWCFFLSICRFVNSAMYYGLKFSCGLLGPNYELPYLERQALTISIHTTQGTNT